MSGPVKSHVLAQMRQALLILILKNRTGIYNQAQFYLLFWLFIFPDVISKPVIEFSDFYIWIDRERIF